MASMQKHSEYNTQYYIRHNMRQLPPNKKPSNELIDSERTKDNYSLISRGETYHKVNEYRKQIESEIFHYNRKNLVRSVEVVITLPKDCPPEQEEAFFRESFKYVVSTLPMGEKCVFLAEVHKDEGEIQKDGVTVLKAPPHLHIMYIPAVKLSTPKTETYIDTYKNGKPKKNKDGSYVYITKEYQYKLCADQLTKKAKLKAFHPNFQQWINKAGIKATVHNKVTGGKNVKVSALKELTKATGLTLSEVRELQLEKESLQELTQALNESISTMYFDAKDKERAIEKLSADLAIKEEQIKELEKIKALLDLRNDEIQHLKDQAYHINTEKEQQIATLTKTVSDKEQALSEMNDKVIAYGEEMERIRSEMTQVMEEKDQEIRALNEELVRKNEELEKERQKTIDRKWGERESWGHRDREGVKSDTRNNDISRRIEL